MQPRLPTHCLGRGAGELLSKHFVNWSVRSSHHSNYLQSRCSHRCSRPVFLGLGVISQLSVALRRGYSAGNPEIPHSRFLSLSVPLAQQMSYVAKSSTSVSLFQFFRNIPWSSSKGDKIKEFGEKLFSPRCGCNYFERAML